MSSAVHAQFVDALMTELSAAIAAVSGAPTPVGPGTGVSGSGLNVSLTVTGAVRGTVRLTFDAAGVTDLLHVVLGPEAETGDAPASDLLREMFGQAIGSLCLKEPYNKVSIAVGSIGRGEVNPDQLMFFSLALGESMLQVAAAATVDVMPIAPDAPKPPAAASAPATRPAVPGRAGVVGASSAVNLDVVMDIELPLSVRFGSTSMNIRSLSLLGPGSIVDMGRSPDDPVEVLVCGRVVARAEVVVVGGNYGIRITDLVSAADRVRAMEGQW